MSVSKSVSGYDLSGCGCLLLRTCPICGSVMRADPLASTPRTFSGELRPRWICPNCGYVVQDI